MKGLVSIAIGGIVVASVGAMSGSASAQTNLEAAKAEAAQRQSRYQIGQLERLFEGAVEHGLSMVRERLQTVAQMPADLLVSDNAHARGFRLEGYGVFFDVSVPSFDASITWSLRTLDQNDLGLDSALRALQNYVKDSGDVTLEQALRRVELQVNPAVLTRSQVPPAGGRTVTASAASVPTVPPPADPILADTNEAYRTEVLQALKDAMLDHSSSLGIGPTEWLTIAAKGNNDDRPRLAPADTDSRTRIIRLRGSDLAAYLARQITREEALQRIEVRVF